MTFPAALALLAAGCAPADRALDEVAWPPAAQAPDAPGPFAVGFRTVTLAEYDPPLVMEVWYPIDADNAASPADPYTSSFLEFPGSAHRDAEMAASAGVAPVAAFSHGYGGIRFQSLFLTEHLAAHGWVVVAPDHAYNTMLDLDGARSAEVAARRPGEIRRAVDALADGRVAGVYGDPSRYAVIGHSFGAWTALAVGGGRIDAAGFQAACAETPRAACGFFEGQVIDPTAAATEGAPDPRAVVTVALAPGGWYAFGPDGSGLADVRNPLVLGGTADADMPYEAEAVPTWEALSAPKRLGGLVDSGHWSFTDLCLLAPVSDCAGVEGGFMDTARARDLIRSRTLAHLRLELLGREADRAWLTGEPDLEWQDRAP
jgi:predicted dienelactone hydrolase